MPFAIIVSAVIGVIGYLIKYRLSQKSEAMAKKREVYEEISTALGVFVAGRDTTPDDKKRFLDQYSKLWLWAPDSVIRAANEFIDIIMTLNSSNRQEQRNAKHAYTNFVIEMRKDLGFPKTSLKFDEYRFGSFGN
jgi:hypothetical protein